MLRRLSSATLFFFFVGIFALGFSYACEDALPPLDDYRVAIDGGHVDSLTSDMVVR